MTSMQKKLMLGLAGIDIALVVMDVIVKAGDFTVPLAIFSALLLSNAALLFRATKR